jgi:hypothetical protein
MADDGVRDQIAQLEEHIERLTGVAERCRKVMLASQFAILVGGMLLLALALRLLAFDPATMVAAMTAAIGGVVMLGSNASTLRQIEATIKTAEALRADLIAQITLRLVPNDSDT